MSTMKMVKSKDIVLLSNLKLLNLRSKRKKYLTNTLMQKSNLLKKIRTSMMRKVLLRDTALPNNQTMWTSLLPNL